MHFKTSFLKVVEHPVRSRKKYKKKTLEVIAYDCKVGSVIPELAKIRFMGKMKAAKFFDNYCARHLTSNWVPNKARC